MIGKLLRAGKAKILLWTLALILVATLADGASGNNISLAALYIVPMMLAAVVLRPFETALLALICSYLRSFFDVPGTPEDLVLRFIFAALAYFVSALFITALVRNHELTVEHLNVLKKEQTLRLEAEDQLKVLAESSPAAILTIDRHGIVLAANSAANKLLMIPRDKTLEGRSIAHYLPSLVDALRWDIESVGLRTTAQSQGYRDNGEIFLANMWFSSYSSAEGKRIAAIVVDSSEEMRDREEQGMRYLFAGNRIATAAIAHEVRNFCEAMAMLCDDLRRRHHLTDDEALRGLDNLVEGLESIASLELKSKAEERAGDVSLKEVLDSLRIVIEPDWREIDGLIKWKIPETAITVWAERHGLLQAFLNVAQNSHRAVQRASARCLDISVLSRGNRVIVHFRDSGPGVPNPEKLFRPFQEDASGSGLGLYVSRFILRSYGGDLRFEPGSSGACFAVELTAV